MTWVTVLLQKIRDFPGGILAEMQESPAIQEKIANLLDLLKAGERALLASTRWRTSSPLRRLNSFRLRLLNRMREGQGGWEEITNPPWPSGLPLVSVVIPCFDYGDYVEDAVDSVLHQTFQNLEIIVVDGGSTDEKTIRKLKSLEKPKTTIHFREGRHLAGDNRNYGIERARGRYICCLDADDMLRPTYLEKALFVAETYHYDIVFPWVECFERKDEIWAPEGGELLTCARGRTLSTVALFRREAWQRVGGYRDWGLGKDHVPEDWDFWLRLLGRGFRARALPEPLLRYRVHGKGLTAKAEGSIPEQRKVLREANQELFTEENLRFVEERNRTRFLVRDPFINLKTGDAGKAHVLLALPFMITGGADSVLLQVADALKRSGFGVSCLTSIPFDAEKLGDNTPQYEKITKEIYHLPRFLTDKRQWKDFLFYLIESRELEVLFNVGCEFVYHLLPELKAHFPHLKVIDQLFNEFGHLGNNRKYAGYIDLNIVASETLREILTREYGEKDEKIRVIIHGIDVEGTFNPRRIPQELVTAAGGIPPEKMVVGFFGRFSSEKCPEAVVDMANAMRDADDVYWVMTGNGPQYRKVKEKIRRMGLEQSITAPGFVDDVRAYLARTDVVVIPSRIEGIPIILMEALAMGIPVVASRIGGVPSIIEEGQNGFLCEPGQVNDFAEKIRLLRSDRSLRCRMGKNAREYAEQHLDVAQMNAAYLEAFLGVVKTSGL